MIKSLVRLKNKIFNSKRFSKFIIFGAFCNILGTTSLYVFTDFLGLHYILSLIITLIYVNFIGFYLNKIYTFKTPKKYFFRELWKYYSVMSSGFCLNVSSMYLLVDIFKIWYIYAAVIVSIGLLFFNFFMHKSWSFKSNKISK